MAETEKTSVVEDTSFPDLDAAEFTPIRGHLARAFLAHKADMGLGDARANGSWRTSMMFAPC
jgi:hypothetical protein